MFPFIEYHMLGLDGLVRTNCRRYANELGDELAAEHAVVFRALIAAFVLDDVAGAPRRHPAELKAFQ